MHFRQQTNCFRPHVLTLEDRCVPSATATIAGSLMTIQADPSGGLIQIRTDGMGYVQVSAAGQSTPLAKASNISKIVVNGGAGSDWIDFRNTGTLKHALDLDLNLAAGNDRAVIDLYRGISGVPVNIDVDGGDGSDWMQVQFGLIVNSQVSMHGGLGAGNDYASIVMFNGLSGHSQADFDIAGDAGADRVELNLMGKIDSTAVVNAHVENIPGADDRLLVRYRGELDGKLNITADDAANRYGIQAWF